MTLRCTYISASQTQQTHSTEPSVILIYKLTDLRCQIHPVLRLDLMLIHCAINHCGIRTAVSGQALHVLKWHPRLAALVKAVRLNLCGCASLTPARSPMSAGSLLSHFWSACYAVPYMIQTMPDPYLYAPANMSAGDMRQ